MEKSAEPVPEEETENGRTGPGKGFGMLFLAVLLLAAILAGLLFWTVRDERARAPKEPEPIRMELGESLEAYLDESAASSR